MEAYESEQTVTQPLKAGRLVWQDDNNHIQEYVLYEGISTTIGRERGNHILLPNPIVSKNHAIIQWKNGAFVITDRGSSNGTFVNRRLIHEPTSLSDSDSIEIGDYRIKFYVMEDQSIEYPGAQPQSGVRTEYEKLSSEITTQRTVPRPYPGGETEKKTPGQEASRLSAPPNPIWLAAEEMDAAALGISDDELLGGESPQESEQAQPAAEEPAEQPPFLSEEDFESLIKAVEAKQAELSEATPAEETPQAEVEEWLQELAPGDEEAEAQSLDEETLIVETEASEEEILSWALDEAEKEELESPQAEPQVAEQEMPAEAPPVKIKTAPFPTKGEQKEFEGAYAGLMESLQTAQENAQILWDKGFELQQKVGTSIQQLHTVLQEMKELEINASEVQLDNLLASLPDTPYDVRLLMNLADNSGLLAKILKESLSLGEMIEKTKLELEEALQQYLG
jgi:hypothetical protein